MRVYGFHAEGNVPVGMKSTATYTRLPARTNGLYQRVAREAVPTLNGEKDANTGHRVKSGENLTQIVRDFLRAQGRTPSNRSIFEGVRNVARQNKLPNADLIHPGQDLDLSVLRERTASVSIPLRPIRNSIVPLPSPSPTPLSARPVPIDSLRETALTQSAAPLKIHASALPASPPTEKSAPLSGHPIQNAPKTVDSSVDTIAALQQTLNGTSNSLTMIQELLEEPETAVTPASAGPWESVLKGHARLSSDYGMRKDPFTGRLVFHDGIDIAAKRGTEITALRGGEVIYSGWKGGYGNTVIVRHEDGFESIYGHTAKNLVSVGETVQAGAILAKVGSTGRSTGPHLHLEMRRHGKSVNPLPLLTRQPFQLAQNDLGS